MLAQECWLASCLKIKVTERGRGKGSLPQAVQLVAPIGAPIGVVEHGSILVESRPYFLLRGSLFMTTVRVKENEPFEVAMRRFKRSVEKTGLLTELRAREFYEKPTAERKRKLAAAVKRHYKRLRSQVLPPKLY